MGKCIYCGSESIIEDVIITEGGDYKEVGPTYKDGLIFRFSIQMYADICKDCGSITRFHVDPQMLNTNLVIKKK